MEMPSQPDNTPHLTSLPSIQEQSQPVDSFGELHQQLISPYIPPSVIVDEHGEIVHLGRGVGPFLHFGEGEPSHNLLKVVQPDLRLDLRSALFMARQHGQSADVWRAQLQIDGETRLVNVIVEPIAEPPWARGHLLVMFQDVGTTRATTGVPPSDAEAPIRQLEAELERTRDQLRTIAEQYETVVEEYKAANRELRADSEELATSKAAVQSINQELTTVNQELKRKVEEISRAHNDLQNLMTSTQIATLFLDCDLRIKRFTPSARQIFNLIPSDLGRPLDHVTHMLRYDGLMQDAAQVLQTCATISREVQTKDDNWYLMRSLPYRTVDDQIDGVVLTFVDITDRKHAEQALRESEERFRIMADAVPQIVWLTDPDGRTEFFNKHWTLYTGAPYEPTTAAGIAADFVHPDDQAITMEAFNEARRRGDTFAVEHRIRSAAGTYRWFLVRAEPYHDPQTGKITRWFGASIDIHDHKQAEEALRKSDERFRTLLVKGTDMITISGRDGAILYASPSTERVSGYTAEEFQGSNPFRDAIHPDDVALCRDAMERLIATPGLSLTLQHRARHKSGDWHWYEGTFTSLFHEPAIGGLVANVRDITERKRAEEELRASEARFRAVADLVPDLLWSNDPRGVTDWFNRRWLEYTGQAFEKAQDYGWLDAIHPDDRETSLRNFQGAVNWGEPLRQEHRIRRADGKYRWFLVQAQPVRDEAGQIVRWYGAATDIHEQRMALAAEQAARTAAEAALKTREQFLSIASHELRTPLTSLIGFAYMLSTLTSQGPEALSAMTARIMRQAQRLNALIDQLLDVSRLQRGQFVVELQSVDIGSIVAQVVEEFRATQLPHTKHPIELHQPEQPLMVAGDPPRLEQVIANLLSNAVKYSPAGGPVRVLVLATVTEVVIEVVDQGIGIPVAAQAQLFEPFYRANNVGSQTSGFGLGLHIVQEIIQRHGGRVEVDSAENQGSTFRVVLPLLTKPDVA